MDFFTTDLNGITEMSPELEARRSILETVQKEPDEDYPDVWLNSGDGIALGYGAGEILLWEENAEIIKMLPDVAIDKAAEAWTLLAGGEYSELEKLPWQALEGEGG